MKKLTLTIVAFLGIFAGAMAQSTATHQVDITINSVAMIRAVNPLALTAAPNSGFTLGAPTTAGAIPSITGTDGGSLWLQYTSIKASTGTPRTIKAALSGTIPTGLSITATAATPIAATGDVGLTNGLQTISATAATMIKNVGSGYTGSATGNGSNVNYDVAITNMADLKVTSKSTLTVTYTLSSE
jgi:hypothetical protein